MDGQTFHWEMLSPEEIQKVLACGDAGQLSKLDPEYLCSYAAEDTDSTYLLLSEILEPALDKFPELRNFHSTYGTALVEMICIQRLTGVQLNVEQLRKHEGDLLQGLAAAQAELEADERVRAGVEAWHGVLLDNVNKQMPVDKFIPKKYPKEPARKFNKDGTLTTVYARWEANCRVVGYEPLRYNDKWTRWWETYLHVKEKVDDFWNMDLEERKDKGLFNFFSNEHRRWFFYDFMQFPISVLTDKEQASTSGNALLGFGDLGKKFEKVDDLKKELQFVESLKNASDMETGIYHPRLKTPGTHTGRLSGDGGLNFQNLPKSRGFLEVFAPRKGRAMMDVDCCALEPTVLAETSRDPGLLSVYGPDAKNGVDIYLTVGTAFPGIGETIRNSGYSPDNPDPVVTDRVKKELKEIRNICKVLHLSAAYGCSARKWNSTLKLQGHNYTLEQCQQFHEAYWKFFRAIKVFEAQLNTQWEKNGGWLLDALGLPFCVDAYARKDIVNRCLHPATLVRVRDFGWKCVVDVDNGDYVWDGNSWVQSAGANVTSQRDTILVGGVSVTPDHLILAEDGVMYAADSFCGQESEGTISQRNNPAQQILRTTHPSYSWREVWRMGCYILGYFKRRCWRSLCALSVHTHNTGSSSK